MKFIPLVVHFLLVALDFCEGSETVPSSSTRHKVPLFAGQRVQIQFPTPDVSQRDNKPQIIDRYDSLKSHRRISESDGSGGVDGGGTLQTSNGSLTRRSSSTVAVGGIIVLLLLAAFLLYAGIVDLSELLPLWDAMSNSDDDCGGASAAVYEDDDTAAVDYDGMGDDDDGYY